jgi:hypothetical protein
MLSIVDQIREFGETEAERTPGQDLAQAEELVAPVDPVASTGAHTKRKQPNPVVPAELHRL